MEHLNYQPARYHKDPMLLFITLMTKTTVLYLYRLMGEVMPDAAHQVLINEYTGASSTATLEITNLAKQLSQMSYFKVRS
jgi:hypothetical protein